MRLAVLICSFAFIATPVFAQSGGEFMPAPSPEPMLLRSAPHAQKLAGNAAQANAQVADPQLDRQVSATQQLIQAEERRLQSQFAQIEKLRSAAIDKQDQKELARIEKIEKQVAVDYQKRVEQILLGAQAQIQATTVHVPAPQTQSNAPQPTPAKRPQAQSPQSQRTITPSAATARPQNTQQQSRTSGQSTQARKSTSFWPFTR